MEASERMVVHLCRPSFPVKRASVVPFHKIVCLTKLFPDQAVEFIWSGQILLQKMTFLFYRIHPLSSIVVLPGETARREAALAAWLAATSDADAFNERIGLSLNRPAQDEVARLRDLRVWRAERRGRSALDLVETFEFNATKFGPAKFRENLKSDFPAASVPGFEPLPDPWMSPV
jgi:hypothetical protein